MYACNDLYIPSEHVPLHTESGSGPPCANRGSKNRLVVNGKTIKITPRTFPSTPQGVIDCAVYCDKEFIKAMSSAGATPQAIRDQVSPRDA